MDFVQAFCGVFQEDIQRESLQDEEERRKRSEMMRKQRAAVRPYFLLLAQNTNFIRVSKNISTIIKTVCG